jgi:hypothetical protein
VVRRLGPTSRSQGSESQYVEKVAVRQSPNQRAATIHRFPLTAGSRRRRRSSIPFCFGTFKYRISSPTTPLQTVGLLKGSCGGRAPDVTARSCAISSSEDSRATDKPRFAAPDDARPFWSITIASVRQSPHHPSKVAEGE